MLQFPMFRTTTLFVIQIRQLNIACSHRCDSEPVTHSLLTTVATRVFAHFFGVVRVGLAQSSFLVVGAVLWVHIFAVAGLIGGVWWVRGVGGAGGCWWRNRSWEDEKNSESHNVDPMRAIQLQFQVFVVFRLFGWYWEFQTAIYEWWKNRSSEEYRKMAVCVDLRCRFFWRNAAIMPER